MGCCIKVRLQKTRLKVARPVIKGSEPSKCTVGVEIGVMLRRESPGFADGIGVGCGRKNKVKNDSNDIVLSNWNDEITVVEMGKLHMEWVWRTD